MPTLLVVDDEPSILYFFRQAFCEPEVTLLTASSAAEGVETVIRDRPDVVILDIDLPDASGLETFRRLFVPKNYQQDPRRGRRFVDKKDGVYFTLSNSGTVLYAHPGAKVIKVFADPVERINGITLSRDEKTLYVATQSRVAKTTLAIADLPKEGGEYILAFDARRLRRWRRRHGE